MILVSMNGLVMAQGDITNDGVFYRYNNTCYQIDNGYQVYNADLPENLKIGKCTYINGEFAEIPQPPAPTREEILAELDAIDIASIRPLRATSAGTATEDDETKLASLEQEAIKLRSILAELEATNG